MASSPLPDISLTAFLQYIAAQTSPTRTHRVEQLKRAYADEHRRGADAYRPLRQLIQLARGASLDIDKVLENCPDKDRRIYALLTRNYNKLLPRLEGDSVGVRATLWVKGGLRVKVDPELAFRHDGVTTYYKLHLAKTGLRGRNTAVICQMMVEALTGDGSETAAVADLRAGRVLGVPAAIPSPSVSLALQLDAEAFVKTWRSA